MLLSLAKGFEVALVGGELQKVEALGGGPPMLILVMSQTTLLLASSP